MDQIGAFKLTKFGTKAIARLFLFPGFGNPIGFLTKKFASLNPFKRDHEAKPVTTFYHAPSTAQFTYESR